VSYLGFGDHWDGHGAVEELLRMGVPAEDDASKAEIERFYDITMKSLFIVWHAVDLVAEALLKHEELSRDVLEELLSPFALLTPVLEVQRGHGLLLGPRGTPSQAQP
jgi:hypothetical protein